MFGQSSITIERVKVCDNSYTIYFFRKSNFSTNSFRQFRLNERRENKQTVILRKNREIEAKLF